MAADIVGFDPNADVALLKVDPEGLDLHPLQLATNEDVEVGQPVAAIGSPFGEDQSLSVGVVSATDRSIQSLTKFQIEGRSRPTPRSTPATRAARCSTPTAT